MLNKISSPGSATHLLKKAATLTMGLMSACSSETVGTRSQAIDAMQNQIDGYISRALYNDASETSSAVLEVDASTLPQDATPSNTTQLCIQDWKAEREMDPCSMVDKEYRAPVMKEFDTVMATLAELLGDTEDPPYIGKGDSGSVHIQNSELKKVMFVKALDSRWTIYAIDPKLGKSATINMSGDPSSGETWSISVLDSVKDPHCEEKVDAFTIGINWTPGGDIGAHTYTIGREVHEDPKDSLCEQSKNSTIAGSCSSGYQHPNITNWCKKTGDNTWHLSSHFGQVYPLEQVQQDLATSFGSMAQIIVENDIDPDLIAWFKPFTKK